jgi:argininosuccinate synthase
MGNVLRGNLYPLCVGAERGLQARIVAQVAREVGADAVAHGCTAAGNDQVRFEVALRTLAPELEIIAPVRDEGFSRAHELAYLRERGVDWPEERAAYSVNVGLWGATIGGRETADTVQPLPEHAWVLTRGAFDAPRAAELRSVSFAHGVPTQLDGQAMDPVPLIERLNTEAGAFGIGRGIHLGDTIFGLKGRVAFEAPAAAVLIAAHRELEKLTLTGRQQRVKDLVAAIYGDLVHEGQFLEPACRDIEALLESSQGRVTGEVRVQFRQGSVFVEGVSSPHSLRAASRAVYGEAAGEWTAADARGFSRMLALPGMLYARAGGGSS